jgi:hypothetical protein
MHPFLKPHNKGGNQGFAFWCPACAAIGPEFGIHVFTVKSADGDADQEWTFDGEASFEPSLAYENEPYCHLHLTNGELRYYADSRHAMAGQVVPMVAMPAGRHPERD